MLGRRTGVVATRREKRVLRRRSWSVLTWMTLSAIWLIYLFGLMISLDRGKFQDAWLVFAIFCAVTATVRRIGSCRIVLERGKVLIENPLIIHSLPNGSIMDVEISSGGGLRIRTRQGKDIRPLVFGGSLVDAYFKTSERAATKIREHLRDNDRELAARTEVQQKFRRCWSADIALVLGCIAGTMATVFA